MFLPWVMDEIRAHPYRMWLIQAVGLLTFTLILVYGMPAHEYTVNVYPTKSPRVEAAQPNKKGVASNQMSKSKDTPVRPPRGSTPDPLPGTPEPRPRPSGGSSEPPSPTPVPDVPSEPTPPTPDDQGTPPSTPNSPTPNEDKPPTVVDIREANEFGTRSPKPDPR